jgi:phosphatidylinositol glycan class N
MRPSTLRLLILSVVYHVVYLSSIFDIYFQSPVVKVSERYSTPGGLAKRVVLIVGDGLRADKLFKLYPNPPFENPEIDPLPRGISNYNHHVETEEEESEMMMNTPAPFLRSLIQTGKAQYGISHTRVPTESRPGHVALIGGMYEDVSAVTRGWTTNPVLFDSVFNQSKNSWLFGSPDILPMFTKTETEHESKNKIREWSYSQELEDFTKDAIHLDLWVLDQLENLFNNATTSTSTNQELRKDGTVFFLHLLGLDTTGHSYRPHGREYYRNIQIVDHVVERTVELFERFYGEREAKETSFIFTADHGMSSLGNHGDGHPDNTRTPLIAWGKGIKQRLDWEEPSNHDEYSKDWRLKGVRRDVEQADVAPLMVCIPLSHLFRIVGKLSDTNLSTVYVGGISDSGEFSWKNSTGLPRYDTFFQS